MLLKLWRQLSAIRPLGYRKLVTEVNSDITRLDNPKSKKRKRKERESTEHIGKEVLAHFDRPESRFILKGFPEELLKKRSKKVMQGLYISNEESARTIASTLMKGLRPDQSLMELNPGLGLLTKRLIDNTENDLLLYEPMGHFHPNLTVSLRRSPTFWFSS